MKPSGPGLLFAGRFLITVSISLLVMGLLRSSIPSYSRPSYLRNLYAIKKQQLEPDMEQCTGSEFGKEHDKTVYCYPAYLIHIQSTSCEMSGWMNHNLESSLPGEISTASDMQIIPF